MRLLFLLLCASAFVLKGAGPPAGRWEGEIQSPGESMRIVVDLAPAEGEGAGRHWRGSAILPGFGIKGTPLSDIVVNNGSVSFSAKGIFGGATFQARVTDPDHLTGTCTLGGNTAPLVLLAAGPAQVDDPPRSTAVPVTMEGVWTGQMAMFDYPILVRLTLRNGAAGTATADLLIKGKRETALTADLVVEEAGLLTVTVSSASIGYEGRFHPQAATLSGTFTNGPFDAALSLRREP